MRAHGLAHDAADRVEPAWQLEREGARRGREAREVQLEPEDAAPEDADPLEDAVAVEQPVVADREARLARVDDRAADPAQVRRARAHAATLARGPHASSSARTPV